MHLPEKTSDTGANLSESSVHVLVVEDEQEIRELMILHLERQGYRVTGCNSAEQALIELSRQSYQLITLDWMLPGLSGVDIVERIKISAPRSSVLMVTAKTEPQDIVAGLEKGADDYITKPFNLTVFLARAKALLRRAQSEGPASISPGGEVDIHGLRINFKSHEIEYAGKELHLTPSEFKPVSYTHLTLPTILRV